LLYLSLYFKQNRADYYRLLDLVRFEGDWEGWIDFFLEGVEQTATAAVQTAQRLVKLFEADRQRIQELGRITATVLLIFGALRVRPILTLKDACSRTGLSFPAASKGMDALTNLRIAKEMTGRQRNRVFVYDLYLTILNEGTEPM
jgi:Fic family protein